MTEQRATGVGRRGFLGYLGSAAAGAAIGGGIGAVARGEGAGAENSPDQVPGRTLSPYGPHQAGITSPTPNVGELVALDLHPDVDREGLGRLLRIWTGDIEALTAGRGAPGDTAPWLAEPAADLTITVGVGGAALRPDRFGAPAGHAEIPAMRHDRLQDRWSGGDLVLLVQGRTGTVVAHAIRRLTADARPFADLRWRQVGFWNSVGPNGETVTGRNLFGQVDGSGNPRMDTPEGDRTVWLDEGPWAGGSTLVVRRIRMDLDTWDELTRDEQERSVGRTLADGSPLTGGKELDQLDDADLTAVDDKLLVIPQDAHSRRSHPTMNGGARILRRGLNYTVERVGDAGAQVESGLLFLSFQAHVRNQFVRIQQTLDESDQLNEWTTAIGSASFAILPGFEQGSWLGQGLLTAPPR